MVGLKKLETTKNGNYILRDPIEEEEKQYTTTNTTGQHQNSTTASTKRTTKHSVRESARVRRTKFLSKFICQKSVKMTEIVKSRIRSLIKIGHFLSPLTFLNLNSHHTSWRFFAKGVKNRLLRHKTFLNLENTPYDSP